MLVTAGLAVAAPLPAAPAAGELAVAAAAETSDADGGMTGGAVAAAIDDASEDATPGEGRALGAAATDAEGGDGAWLAARVAKKKPPTTPTTPTAATLATHATRRVDPVATRVGSDQFTDVLPATEIFALDDAPSGIDGRPVPPMRAMRAARSFVSCGANGCSAAASSDTDA